MTIDPPAMPSDVRVDSDPVTLFYHYRKPHDLSGVNLRNNH
jgi:hypothetical protein